MKDIIKRFIDIVGGVIGTIILIPLTITICIAKIIVKEKGSIFFCQRRIGKNGKIFKMYKYRSMTENAENDLEKYMKENESLRREYNKYKKIKNDPRITKIGKFIRKTNLDEFPQFINVLRGDMSLVGPRPYLESEIKEMKESYKKITEHKPGITGLWQINQEKYRSFDNRIELDIKYINNNNLIKDIKILLKTIKQLTRKIYKINVDY